MAAVHYFEQLNTWSRILVKKLAFFEVLNSTHFAGPEGSLPTFTKLQVPLICCYNTKFDSILTHLWSGTAQSE